MPSNGDRRERIGVALAHMCVRTVPNKRMKEDVDLRFLAESYLEWLEPLPAPTDAIVDTIMGWPAQNRFWPDECSLRMAIMDAIPALTTDVPNAWKQIMQQGRTLEWVRRVVDAYRHDGPTVALGFGQQLRLERQALSMVSSYGEQPASIGLGDGWPEWSAEECLRRAGV